MLAAVPMMAFARDQQGVVVNQRFLRSDTSHSFKVDDGQEDTNGNRTITVKKRPSVFKRRIKRQPFAVKKQWTVDAGALRAARKKNISTDIYRKKTVFGKNIWGYTTRNVLLRPQTKSERARSKDGKAFIDNVKGIFDGKNLNDKVEEAFDVVTKKHWKRALAYTAGGAAALSLWIPAFNELKEKSLKLGKKVNPLTVIGGLMSPSTFMKTINTYPKTARALAATAAVPAVFGIDLAMSNYNKK